MFETCKFYIRSETVTAEHITELKNISSHIHMQTHSSSSSRP